MIQSILDDRGEDIPLPETQDYREGDPSSSPETLPTSAEVKLARYSLSDSVHTTIDILGNSGKSSNGVGNEKLG